MNTYRIHWEEEWASARILKPFDIERVEAGFQEIELLFEPEFVYVRGQRVPNPNHVPYRFNGPAKCGGETLVKSGSRKDALAQWYDLFPFSNVFWVDEVEVN